MSSQLLEVRREVVRRLKLARTRAGDRVHPNRFRPVHEDDLPAILVYTLEEEDDDEDSSPRQYLATVQLAVTVVVKYSELGQEDADEELDRLGQVCRDVLFFDTRLGGLLDDLKLKRWEIAVLDPIAGVPMAAGRLVFEASYRTDAPEGADPGALEDFLRLHAEHGRDARPGGEPDATDDVELERPGSL